MTVRNAADEQQVKEASHKAKRGRDLELDDVRFVMNAPQGRRFMNRLIEFCGVNRSSFTGNSTTFFNEGQRNVGLMLFADVEESCPELYLLMRQEARKREETNV